MWNNLSRKLPSGNAIWRVHFTCTRWTELLGAPLFTGRKMDAILADRWFVVLNLRLPSDAYHCCQSMTRLFCSRHHSAHLKWCTQSVVVHLALIILLLKLTTSYWGKVLVSSPIWTFLMFSGSRPAYLWRRAGWVYAALPRGTVCFFSVRRRYTAALHQQLLLRSPTFATADSAVSLVSNVWSSANNSPCPTGLAAYRQAAWDRPVISTERQELMKSKQRRRSSTTAGGNISQQRLATRSAALRMWITTRWSCHTL